MSVLGIDPGKTGGLALFDGKSVVAEVMPIVGDEIDLSELCRWLRAHRDEIEAVFLEKAGSFRVARNGFRAQGSVGMFNYGNGFGAIRGILTALHLSYELVPPQAWTRIMHAGTAASLHPKERSAVAASRLFPGVDLRATARSKKAHEGMVDAVLLAAYGHRMRQRGSL